MEKLPIPFRFIIEESGYEFTINYEIPDSLIGQGSVRDAGFGKLFIDTVSPMLKDDKPDCIRQANQRCTICQSLTTTVLPTPISWLHIPQQPFILVLVSGVCGNAECEPQIRLETEEMMADMGASPPEQVSMPTRMAGCWICRNEGLKRGSSLITLV